MAKIKAGAGFGLASGRLGNVVFIDGPQGALLRQTPANKPELTAARQQMRLAMARANALWKELTSEQVQSWREYALALSRNRAADQAYPLSAVNVFTGLTTKYLQVHGGFDAPAEPPAGNFLGDVVGLSLASAPGEIVLTASQANQPGVTTELLAQWVSGPHTLPRPKSFKSYGFVQFTAPGEMMEIPVRPGTWVVAYRFVELASGRATELLEVGRVAVDL